MRLIALVLIAVMVAALPAQAVNREGNKIIRIHVLAHNDSAPEQELKLQVRDAVMTKISELLDGVDDFSRAEELVGSHLPLIKELAENRLRELGSGHVVSLQWGKFVFPTRVYGQITLPAGVYPALNVNIGAAQGKNWWCVMYPPLCHVDGVVGKGQGARYEFAFVNLLRSLWQRIWT